jgi:hypothetical protein
MQRYNGIYNGNLDVALVSSLRFYPAGLFGDSMKVVGFAIFYMVIDIIHFLPGETASLHSPSDSNGLSQVVALIIILQL